MSLPRIDVIIVGSGPSGAQAAQTLVEAGCSVVLIDTGILADPSAARVPDRSFLDIRRSDENQHRYFLGDDFSGIPLTRIGAAPQVTPPRRHLLTTPTNHPTIISEAFAALESHALGGLGGAWGAVSFPFSNVELERAGLDPSSFANHYTHVARRIGVSGPAQDDLSPWRGPVDGLQPPLAMDHNASLLYETYNRRRARLHDLKLRVGRPVLAALSRDLGDRRANALLDTDFWTNAGLSVYRPEITINSLQQQIHFRYESGWMVEDFAESDSGVAVRCRRLDGDESCTHTARRLLIAAGALGTTRIVLNTFREQSPRVPLVCNAHLYVPCLNLKALGRPHAVHCHSLAQLTLMYDPHGDARHLVQAQMYSYRSLMMFRLLKEIPLPGREALRIARWLASSLVIWAVEEEDEPSPEKFCRLKILPDGRHTLEVAAPANPEVERGRRASEAVMMRGMRTLGCWPIRRVHSGHGSSLHYGGQFPRSDEARPFTTDRSGRLHHTRSVYLADGSALRYLPAKGLTFTLMANAHRVATEIVRSFRDG